MPGKGIACSLEFDAGIGIIDSEVEGDNRIATIDIGLCESGGRGGCCIGIAVP